MFCALRIPTKAAKWKARLENLLRVMKITGIEFDEGPILEGNNVVERGSFGPYTQSERLDIYHRHVKELIEKKAAYYCFCTQERLDEVRKEQVALKKPPMYDRHCRNLSAEEIEQKLAESSRKVVRQAIPLEGKTIVKDLIYGEISFNNEILDDQVLLKSDGFPTYHLAVVVDDHHMQISHVIRGEDWINSTPKHVLLYEAFGWEATQFAHLPNILNENKTKLSKRQGDVSVEDFLKKGYLPEALVNFVALLGWNPKTEQEFFTMSELITQFDLAKVNKAGAVFDIRKLDWVNGHYLRNKPNEELVELSKTFWKEEGIDVSKFDDKYLSAILDLEKERLKKLSEIPERTKYFFVEPEYDASLLVWKKSTPEDAKEKLSQLKEFFSTIEEDKLASVSLLEEAIKQFIAEHDFDNGSVLWPLRTALTGEEKSPSPFEVAAVLYLGWGRKGLISRLDRAVNKLA
jgi:nondiscriminating glutamyl-tRNA synthetase